MPINGNGEAMRERFQASDASGDWSEEEFDDCLNLWECEGQDMIWEEMIEIKEPLGDLCCEYRSDLVMTYGRPRLPN